MASDGLYSATDTTVLLLSCLNDYEVGIVVGLLQENGIEVFVDTKEGLLTQYEVFVFNRDLPKAKQLLADSSKVFESIKDPSHHDSRSRDKIILRILLLLTSLFFAVISYYAFVSSEHFMGLLILGISIFFLVIFIFSFEWSRLGRRSRASEIR